MNIKIYNFSVCGHYNKDYGGLEAASKYNYLNSKVGVGKSPRGHHAHFSPLKVIKIGTSIVRATKVSNNTAPTSKNEIYKQHILIYATSNLIYMSSYVHTYIHTDI